MLQSNEAVGTLPTTSKNGIITGESPKQKNSSRPLQRKIEIEEDQFYASSKRVEERKETIEN